MLLLLFRSRLKNILFQNLYWLFTVRLNFCKFTAFSLDFEKFVIITRPINPTEGQKFFELKQNTIFASFLCDIYVLLSPFFDQIQSASSMQTHLKTSLVHSLKTSNALLFAMLEFQLGK